MPIRQVSWLTGRCDALSFPFRTEQWNCEIVPELQWRDRAGFAPASLLTLRRGKAPDGSYSIVRANALSHYSLSIRKKEVSTVTFPDCRFIQRPDGSMLLFLNSIGVIPVVFLKILLK